MSTVAQSRLIAFLAAGFVGYIFSWKGSIMLAKELMYPLFVGKEHRQMVAQLSIVALYNVVYSSLLGIVVASILNCA